MLHGPWQSFQTLFISITRGQKWYIFKVIIIRVMLVPKHSNKKFDHKNHYFDHIKAIAVLFMFDLFAICKLTTCNFGTKVNSARDDCPQLFFFYSSFTSLSSFYTHIETNQSVGGAKTGVPGEKPPGTPASRTWLVPHVTRAPCEARTHSGEMIE